MAAKLLHSLVDDNQDLQKQIGCMTGIFQMFDRQHLLIGDRRVLGHSTKELPRAGNSRSGDGSSGKESNGAQSRTSSFEKYSNKNTQDRQRVSIESSRPSFSSSSRSSSFSSLDCNRATQLDPPPFDRMVFPETPSSSQKDIDLRDLVKDSMYREDKYRDSPRVQSKINDSGAILGKKRSTPADIKESLRILAKLQETPYCHNEPRQLLRSSSYHSKSGSSFSISKDAPRFSYDGREANCVDGPNTTLKLKDLPRLSLDSRESSMRSEPKSNFPLKSMHKDSGVVDCKVLSDQQTLHENQTRPPSVVAKLMGLETLPYSASSADSNMGSRRSYLDENSVNISSSFGKTDPTKEFQSSTSSKNSWKDPCSPRWRSSDCSMKPMSRLPIEPAPWKQIDGIRGSQKPASKGTRGPAKGTTVFPSVYSEIEKRLKDLEFTQSGKDLRALKQILEAMQSKGLLETPKEGEGSNFTSYKDHEQKLLTSKRSVDSRKSQTDQVLAIKKRTALSAYESPIVIMKPAKLVDKSSMPAASIISLDGLSRSRNGLNSGRTSKDSISKSSQRDSAPNSVNFKSNRSSKTAQASEKSHQSAKEGPISPRMQQKKLELEKRSRPPTPPDSSKSRRQSNKQHVESNSPGGRRRVKCTISQQSDELSEVCVGSENVTSVENEDLAQSNETILQGSRNIGVASSEKKTTLMLAEEEAAEFDYVPPEYSSPVSVLDNVVYKNDSPSPVKNEGKTLKVDASKVDERNLNAVEQSSSDSFRTNSIESNTSVDFNRKKLDKIENLVQKLRRLNSSHDEARVDYIASLCEKTNPDHRYVSEILLASGLLLRDLGSGLTNFQFHPSGYPINPELFLVLEQTKSSKMATPLTTNEKLHRKLIFDAVNDILLRKLASGGPHPKPWWGSLKLARKAMNAQILLKELCSEIEGLQPKDRKCSYDEEDDGGWKMILCDDVMHRDERWIDFDAEISGAVLDVERLIFKDLVDEIVRGESARLITKSGRRKPSAN